MNEATLLHLNCHQFAKVREISRVFRNFFLSSIQFHKKEKFMSLSCRSIIIEINRESISWSIFSFVDYFWRPRRGRWSESATLISCWIHVQGLTFDKHLVYSTKANDAPRYRRKFIDLCILSFLPCSIRISGRTWARAHIRAMHVLSLTKSRARMRTALRDHFNDFGYTLCSPPPKVNRTFKYCRV